MKDFFTEHIVSILSMIFGAGGFYDSYKQRKKNQADALDRMQATYDKFVEDFNERYNDLKQEVSDLKKNHHQELINLKNYWETKYSKLKKEFEDYKKRVKN